MKTPGPIVLASFDSHRIEVRNTQDDRGVILDLTQFAGRGGLTVDFQGQWYEAWLEVVG